MNERIRELRKQAMVREAYYPAGNDGHPEYRVYLNEEKFAELIIRECVSLRTELSQFDNSTAYGDGYENGLKDLAESIIEHFGIEK